MSQFCQLLKNGNIVVAVCAIPKIILQCFSSLYTAHKFELSNEYEATAMPDTSLEIKECCQFLISWPIRALPLLTFTQVSLKVMCISPCDMHWSSQFLCDSPWGILQLADESTHVSSNAYNSIHYNQYCIQHYRILNDKLQHLTLWKTELNRKWVFN